MKKFLALLVLLLPFSFLHAQHDEMQSEGVRAFQAGDYSTARSLFESLLEIDPKNPAARNYLRAIALRESNGAGLEATLKNIVIPALDFEDVSVREAVAFVSQKVSELSGGKQSLNVVWMVSPEGTARITLNLQNVPALEVLRYIGDAANLRFSYDAYAVKIRPMDGKSAR
ncbi:MAG TPA: tetratricopeptide repeat protein [Terrimicrobiaceae bacterium]